MNGRVIAKSVGAEVLQYMDFGIVRNAESVYTITSEFYVKHYVQLTGALAVLLYVYVVLAAEDPLHVPPCQR
jgi:hypothetical protein